MVSSQRPISTFCWLPPDRFSIALVQVGRLDPQRVLHLLAIARRPSPSVDEAGLDVAAGCSTAICMFSSTSRIRKQPVSLRSSVRKAMPWRIAMRGESIATGWPRIAIVPEVAGVTPKMRLGDVAAPRADQAGDAQDLARAHLERDVVEHAVEA